MKQPEQSSSNFIRKIIQEDLKSGKHQKIVTRFPPEPNGYLHIGHAKSICLNFTMASENPGGVCHLRFDDTNPAKEEQEFVDSIIRDVKWLGFDWGDNLFYSSDYFETLYQFALQFIREGKAFVCDQTFEQMQQFRGSLTEPGKESPFRNRTVEENLTLFEKMRQGEFEKGEKTLRLKIDMASPIPNLRDPVIYRILKAKHHRTGDKWKIYPMYDYTHCISDYIEGITHSLCTLEFEDHRPLYDWILNALNLPNPLPRQIEFAKLDLNYTVLSKRNLRRFVEEGHVNGWDDPRMPTISGLRRRGFSARGIRNFCERIGVAKKNGTIDLSILDDSIRADLEISSSRVLAILKPLKVVITNFPSDEILWIEVKNHPKDEAFGKRKIPFSNTLYIEQDDFLENPSNKFFRLSPGGKVRLRYGFVIQCEEVIKDSAGNITELRCTYDEETFAGKTPEGQKKVKGIIHWVCAKKSFQAEVRLYDRLFAMENPMANKEVDVTSLINKNSLEIITNAQLEPSLKMARPEQSFQFERLGYFCVDNKDFKDGTPIFNRTVTLRDSWAKEVK